MKTSRTFAALGLAVGLTVGGATGLVLAVPSLSGAQSSDTTAPADESPRSKGDRPDRGTHLAEVLGPLVEDGTLTQEQADKVIAALEAARPDGRGPGKGGPGRALGLEAAAGALSISVDELSAELRSGRTIAEVAAERGVDVQTVIDAMVGELRTRLEERVAAGDLTQEQVDEKLAEATERITEQVDESMPTRPAGPRGGRGGPGGHDGPDGSTDTTVEG